MPDLDSSFYPFISWFQAHGGTIESSFGLTTFTPDEGGRGAVALKDIPESHVLFTIPRSLVLSNRTSVLPSLFGLDRWKKAAPAGFGLDKGWTGLILCMMWEEANHGQWAPYLASLPSQFDTPMFWTEEELAELKGTSVVDKLGKADAERDYHERLLPVIQSRKDLFYPHHIPFHYTLEKYHIHGSRILSRSFSVEPPTGHEEVDGQQNGQSDHAMDVDETPPDNISDAGDSIANVQDGEDSDDEDDEAGIVSMVPMADMLNARYGSENAKLFYEENELRMVSTKPIKAGEQIFNTYNDLPNAELLRRYGHVDLLPLPKDLGLPLPSDDQGILNLGNPGDVVEIRADIVVNVIIGASSPSVEHAENTEQNEGSSSSAESMKGEFKNRIDWWLEMGGDDVFVLEPPTSPLPEDLISLIRLLLYDAEWEKAQEKEKPPKAKLDKEVLTIISAVLERRIALYDGRLEDDEAILASSSDLPLHKKYAVIVRLGEKRILRGVHEKVNRELAKLNEKGKEDTKSAGSKRKGGNDGEGKGKKSRR